MKRTKNPTYQFPDLDPDILAVFSETIENIMLYAKPATVQVGDLDGERKKPGRIRRLVDHNEARGLHTKKVQSLGAPNPTQKIPKWACDDRAVLNVLSFLYTDSEHTSLAYDIVNYKWRKQEPADGSLVRDMSDEAIKQTLYRIRQCGNEVLGLGQDDRWQLTKKSFRRLVDHYRKKRKLSPERKAFYDRYLSGENIHMWDWPTPYIKLSLGLLAKSDPEKFKSIMRDLVELLNVIREIKLLQPHMLRAALLLARLEKLDPFYNGLFDFTTD